MSMSDPDDSVCVVDDDRDAIDWIRHSLELRGFVVDAYESAEDFLSNRESTRTSCLILEAALPGATGLELQEELLSQGLCPPTIFVTRDSDPRSCVRAIKNGAIDYLTKPVEKHTLLRLVRQAVRKVL